MLIKKITTGFVIQTWDTEKKKWVNQEFVAGDDCSYEGEFGESIDDVPEDKEGNESYLPFEMVQP